MMLVSSDPQQQGLGQAQRRVKGALGRTSPQRPPQHVLSAAEAAAHLSAVIRQRRIATRLGVAGAAREAGGHDSAAASGSSLDAAAAVAAVQQHLMYAQFELSIAELQATAVNLPLPPAPDDEATGAQGTASPTGVAGSAAGRALFGQQTHTVLQPMRLGGTLKMHRISEASGGRSRWVHPFPTSAASRPSRRPAGPPPRAVLLPLAVIHSMASLPTGSSLPSHFHRTTPCHRCSSACRQTPSPCPSPSTSWPRWPAPSCRPRQQRRKRRQRQAQLRLRARMPLAWRRLRSRCTAAQCPRAPYQRPRPLPAAWTAAPAAARAAPQPRQLAVAGALPQLYRWTCSCRGWTSGSRQTLRPVGGLAARAA